MSKSKKAQEKLVKLEKASASFEEHLEEAYKFVGVRIKDVDQPFTKVKKSASFGREEWLSRWLLKRLQALDGDSARKDPLSWRLLAYLFRSIPVANLARILSEKKFLSILKQSLETVRDLEHQKASDTVIDQMSTDHQQVGKNSKKRKRNGEIVNIESSFNLHDWMDSAYTAVSYLVELTKSIGASGTQAKGHVFSAEYMKTVLRTTAEESAQTLGAWLLLCGRLTKQLPLDDTRVQFELSAFIEVWQHHFAHSEDLVLFSLHCSSSLLSLLHTLSKGDLPSHYQKAQLEQLVACNIIIPAKADFSDDNESDLLGTLTRVCVLQYPANASILFDVAIRSVPSPGSKPRRPHDAAWLQKTFVTFKEAMPSRRSEEQHDAIYRLLQAAITHKVELDPVILRDTITIHGMQDGSTHWGILSKAIELDSTVFMTPDKKEDVLPDLLARITKESTMDAAWSKYKEKVITRTIVPLMKAFAKSRALSDFIRHWYAQLVEVANLRQNSTDKSLISDSAWESHHLQKALGEVFEASFTIKQIQDLLTWLDSKVDENPGSVGALLEAIAGSLTQEAVIDAVGLRLFHTMFNIKAFEGLEDRYKAKCWRILTQTLPQLPNSQLEELALLWKQGATPFDRLTLNVHDAILENGMNLAHIEGLRFACAAWLAAPTGSTLEALSKPIVLGILDCLASAKWGLPIGPEPQKPLLTSQIIGNPTSMHSEDSQRGWSQISAIIVDYPRVFSLASELSPTQINVLLQSLIWGQSMVPLVKRMNTPQTWLKNADGIFEKIWSSIWSVDDTLNDATVIDHLIDILLSQETYEFNNYDSKYIPDLRKECDALAVRLVLDLPIEVLSRKHRERIMQRWSFQSKAYSSIVHPAVLSMRIKLLQRPTFYECMSFRDLLALIPLVDVGETLDLRTVLQLLKKVVQLTLVQIGTNLDQRRSRNYFTKALQKMEQTLGENLRKKDCSPALYTILQPLLVMLNEKSSVLEELGIMTKSEALDLQQTITELVMDYIEPWTNRLGKHSQGRGATYDAVLGISLMDMISDPPDPDLRKRLYNAAETHLAKRVQQACNAEASEMPAEADALDYKTKSQPASDSIYGRQRLVDAAKSIMTSNPESCSETLVTALKPKRTKKLTLEDLLHMRQIIQSHEDPRSSKTEENAVDKSPLATAYFGLCRALHKATSIRQFSMISETLDMMLQTKSHAVSQWNIDTTLSTITLICSRQGPRFRPAHSGIIYLRLCALLRTILVAYSHRLKLQGHYHLLLQTMQSLLRCLFLPLSHSHSTKNSVFSPPPPWLVSTHPLKAKHASAFTRLVTSICDPTNSSVSRQQRSGPQAKATLTSATEKAKKIAGQHMQFLLTLYIKGQLEMRMLPEVRDKLVPGIYAIFDTTTKDMRKAIGEGLDSNGRAILHMLIKDWLKFGKWGGS